MYKLFLLFFLLACSSKFNVTKSYKLHNLAQISEVEDGNREIGDGQGQITASSCIELITEIGLSPEDDQLLHQWQSDEGNILMWITERVKSIKNLMALFYYALCKINDELTPEAMSSYLNNNTNSLGRSLIFLSVVNKKDYVFNKLIEEGCNAFDEKDINGDSPISTAVLKGYERMLDKMLKIRPDILNKVVMKGGYTLICVASMLGNMNIVKKLIDKRANLDLGGVHGHPLAIASVLGFSKVVQLLVRAGADVDIRYNDEQPMVWAASIGEVEIVEWLLASQARVSGGKMRKIRQVAKYVVDVVARAADVSLISVGVPGNAGVAKSIVDKLMFKIKKMSDDEKKKARDVVKNIKDNYFWILKIDNSKDVMRYGSYYRNEISERITAVGQQACMDTTGNANRCFDTFTQNETIISIREHMDSRKNKVKKRLSKIMNNDEWRVPLGDDLDILTENIDTNLNVENTSSLSNIIKCALNELKKIEERDGCYYE